MRPLEVLEVVALEQAIAVPVTSARQADAGAHLVKSERPECYFADGYDDVEKRQTCYFVRLDMGQQSVTLDLSSDAGRERLPRLIPNTDLLVQNLELETLARLGFDLDRGHAENPRLAHLTIAPHGVFQPKSGAPVLISMPSAQEWRMQARDSLGDESLCTDPRFATNVTRMANRAETDGVVGAALTSIEAFAQLCASEMALATVSDMASLSGPPNLRLERPYRSVKFPSRAPAPRFIGEDRHFFAVPALNPLEA